MTYVSLDEAMIQKIAAAVLTKLEPVLLHRFSELNGRLQQIELAVAPITGRTIHDMHGHLAVSSVNVERLADSYEKLTGLLDLELKNRAAHHTLVDRVGKVESDLRRLKEDQATAEENGC